jgi:hypothetical protein
MQKPILPASFKKRPRLPLVREGTQTFESLCWVAPTKDVPHNRHFKFQFKLCAAGLSSAQFRIKIDLINKWLTAVANIAVIIGVAFAIVGVVIAIQTLKQTQQIASATLILKLRDDLDGNKYSKITAEIQNHDQNHPLLSRADGGRGGAFRQIDIEGYIGNFEDIGYLIQDGVILSKMAYDHFSYDVEKAWCNKDVKKLIAESRKIDRSTTASSDQIYGKFERLAQSYLSNENQSCKDLDKQ